MKKFHIDRGFIPAAPHTHVTLCGLNRDSVPLCGYSGKQAYDLDRYKDVDDKYVCRSCVRIATWTPRRLRKQEVA